MDFSRAKTVLIAAFFCLNLFLLYQIWLEESSGNPGLFGQREEVSRLETALQEASLSLEVSLPRGGLRAAHLVVMPWQPALEEVARDFWLFLQGQEGDEALWSESEFHIIEEDEHKGIVYSWGEREIKMKGEGSLSFLRALQGLSRDKVGVAAEEMAKEISFLRDFVYDYKVEAPEEVILRYYQKYEGFPLYAGYLQFTYREGADGDIDLYRLEPLGFAEQQREVIPPATALWRFLEAYTAKQEFPAAIIDFGLGYYSKEYDAQRWEIAPVWRIRLSNGEIYYINAFTGYLEN